MGLSITMPLLGSMSITSLSDDQMISFYAFIFLNKKIRPEKDRNVCKEEKERKTREGEGKKEKITGE